jgi:starvation-inducible DNA-binding protein
MLVVRFIKEDIGYAHHEGARWLWFYWVTAQRTDGSACGSHPAQAARALRAGGETATSPSQEEIPTMKKQNDGVGELGQSQPRIHQRAHETQPFNSIVKLPIALDIEVCRTSVDLLNQLLADTMTLRDLYKKHHWQLSGHTFYQLHLLFDKHFEEQSELVDQIAERIQVLGGLSIAMAHDVAETTMIPRPPKGREEPPVQISRLLEAHELILKQARTSARLVAEAGDDGTNDLLVSSVIRTNELQVWFVSEHVVETPLVHAS